MMTDNNQTTQQQAAAAEEERFIVTFSDAPPQAQQQAAQQQADVNPEGDTKPADADQKGDATPSQESVTGKTDDTSAHEAESEGHKPRLQKRIDRLTKEKHDLRRENEDLKAKLSQGKPEGDADNEPDITDFDNFDDYQKAKKEFNQRQNGDQPAQKAEEAPAQKLPVEVLDALGVIRDSIDDGKRKYADFEQVINADDFFQTNEMVTAIAECDKPEDITYYLATHKDESARIAGLSPAAQAKEIGKIEARLAAAPLKPTKKITAAPPPIDPVGGSGDVPRTLKNVTSQAEYESLRTAQDKAAGHDGWL
ncbi:MAG: hypothetical protein K4305_08985 [Chlorobium sp.]|uniref:hypothetical protein n=1 Tax=Chlorobium sp. TaxID=1095 RepID=UPI002F42477F